MNKKNDFKRNLILEIVLNLYENELRKMSEGSPN